MKVRGGRSIGSISVSLLLLSSVYVIVDSGRYAEAEPAPITSSAINAAASSADSDEVAAASGSNRFVVWADGTPGNGEIFFRRSNDNGATWQPIVNLSNNPDVTFFPQIASSGSNVYVVWQSRQSSSGVDDDIFFRRSADNDATWKSVRNLSDNAGNSVGPQIAL